MCSRANCRLLANDLRFFDRHALVEADSPERSSQDHLSIVVLFGIGSDHQSPPAPRFFDGLKRTPKVMNSTVIWVCQNRDTYLEMF